LAAKSEPVGTRGRSFGLMPTLDISRAAQSAIDRIEKRCGANTPGCRVAAPGNAG
jgi:hypothetical protein